MVYSVTCASAYCAHTGYVISTTRPPSTDATQRRAFDEQQLLYAEERGGLARHPPALFRELLCMLCGGAQRYLSWDGLRGWAPSNAGSSHRHKRSLTSGEISSHSR